jgi:hypothetical protein
MLSHERLIVKLEFYNRRDQHWILVIQAGSCIRTSNSSSDYFSVSNQSALCSTKYIVPPQLVFTSIGPDVHLSTLGALAYLLPHQFLHTLCWPANMRRAPYIYGHAIML